MSPTEIADVATVDTPVGAFTALADPDGAVLASGWTTSLDELLGVVHHSLTPATVRERADLGATTKAVTAYFAGDVAAIDDVPVTQRSGEFLEHAWTVLRAVEPGAPVTYADYAVRCGQPRTGARAAAQACGRNAAALFVPCHRVLRIGGTLGGFRWGLPVKRWLLDHERAATTH